MNSKILTLLTSAIIISSFAHAGLYRWVDEKGEVHFSDKVPVSASQQKHKKINKNGAVEKESDPEKLKEQKKERELLALQKEEAARIDKIIREKRAKIRKRDRYLLSTYESKQELITSFETKIKMLKGNSSILSSHNNLLKRKINKLKTEKSAGDNKALNKKIVNISETIDLYKKALIDNKLELTSLETSYKADLTRFSELTH